MDINLVYDDFIEKFNIVLFFISKNFGDKDILRLKNEGLLKERNFEIKNSQIKSYVFHGCGCDFAFKKSNIDVEFSDNIIGFTEWSFYTFIKRKINNISEIEIKEFLTKKVNKKELNYNTEVYFL